MRRSRRGAATALAVGLTLPLWAATPAIAADLSGSEPASSGAYFSSAGIAKPDVSPQAPPNVTASADGVGPGNLAVAARAGMEDKVSFLFFSLNDVPLDGVVTKAVLTVPLVANDPDNLSSGQAPEKVRACKAADTGFGGEDGAALSLAPERLCEEFQAPGKASDDGKGYVFDITALAATWLDSNDGVALTTADGASTTPFQVVFGSAEQSTLSYSYSAPEPEAVVALPVEPDTGSGVVDAPTFDSGTSGGGFAVDEGVGSDGGFTGSTDAPVIDSGPVDAAPVDSAPVPEAAAPVTAVTVTSVARELAAPTLRPSASAWLGGLLLVAALALLSLVLGDPRVPQRAASTTRLSAALQARERTAAAVQPQT